MFYEMHNDPNASYNAAIHTLIKRFFKVEPQGPTAKAATAKFNAFGSSPQKYMPDVGPTEKLADFSSMTAAGIAPGQIRLRELINRATVKDCLTLFTVINEKGEHVLALDCIDPGKKPDLAQFVVRNDLNVDGGIYTPLGLSGINKAFGFDEGKYSSLPEISRNVFPDGQKSWELIILPPDPAL